MNVLTKVYLVIRNEFDSYSFIRKHLADKNLFLSGSENNWMAITSDGDVIAYANSPADLAGQLLGH